MAVQLARTLKHSDQADFLSQLAATTSERPITQEAVRQFPRDLDGVNPDDVEVEAPWTFVSAAPGIPTRDEALNISMKVSGTYVITG